MLRFSIIATDFKYYLISTFLSNTGNREMDIKDFRKHAHKMVDEIADYFENIEEYSPKSLVKPGDILAKLPYSAPKKSEAFEDIYKDFQDIIMPGITHWQHPKFMAYFPANSSYPAILGELLSSALASQCMIWETSPAAAELEERVMQWLKQMCGLPNEWEGVIQDTASTATLVALLTARERAVEFSINSQGFTGKENFTVYCSEQAHSSIEKAVKIAGFGRESLRLIKTDESFAMDIEDLGRHILEDKRNGMQPCFVVAAIGTTGSTAVDPLKKIGQICRQHNIWLHVDAAYAGSAMILPEYRHLIEGTEYVDSYAFNPHKWLFTNFDCTAYFVKDKDSLIRTFEILPEYLKTKSDNIVNNYRDWGIQLGRRFRALKLWFVIRSFGLEKMQDTLRNHIKWVHELADKMEAHPDFEILAPVNLNLICFRYKPDKITSAEELNKINAELLESINSTGDLYLTHTKLNGQYVIRIVAGQTYLEERHIKEAWETILMASQNL